jgi:hypothetical protein
MQPCTCNDAYLAEFGLVALRDACKAEYNAILNEQAEVAALTALKEAA